MYSSSKKRVVVAMSGGVDSSVVAALLHQKGYEVIGLSAQTFDASGEKKERYDSCCSLSDMDDARRVCERLGIPHFVVNAEKEFKTTVMDNFVEEYMQGRTPNPCIHCNNHIKFDFLWQKAKDLGAPYIATGHYAKVSYSSATGRYYICQATDVYKDQSYYLFGLTQEQLSHILLPLGDKKKMEVRKLAEEFSLQRVSQKPDSHEICFIASGTYRDFIAKRKDLKDTSSVYFVLPSGERFPSSQGIHEFTVGQKKGIPHFLHQKMAKLGNNLGDIYVKKVDSKKQEIHLGVTEDLMEKDFFIEKFHWMSREDFVLGEKVLARIRSLAKPVRAQVVEKERDCLKLSFEEPQRAITPGQAVVLYGDYQEVLGGGWISR